jgi:hypothetical protein
MLEKFEVQKVKNPHAIKGGRNISLNKQADSIPATDDEDYD